MTTAAIRPSVHVDGHRLTIPIPEGAQAAFDEWIRSRHDELVDVLAPFGLHPYDLAEARLERVVVVDDVRRLAAHLMV
jgi:hypothetical protein